MGYEDTVKLGDIVSESAPPVGVCEKKAGELAFAVNKIAYRFFQYGEHIGIEKGNEELNPVARYILFEYPNEVIAKVVNGLWGLIDKETYEKGVNLLIEETVKFIEGHPELREIPNEDDCEQKYLDEDDEKWEEEEEEVHDGPWAVYDPE